jgi:THO complex subunit 1
LKFNNIQAEYDKVNEHEDRKGNKKRRKEEKIINDNTSHTYFFPKYLTEPSLFKLELANPFFRRQILVQSFIFLQYLEFLELDNGSTFKIKSSKDVNDFNELKRKVKATLERVTPHGKEFYNAAMTMMGHEKNWVNTYK